MHFKTIFTNSTFLIVSCMAAVAGDDASLLVDSGTFSTPDGVRVVKVDFAALEDRVQEKLGKRSVADFSGLLTLLVASKEGELQSWGHASISQEGSVGIEENGALAFFYLPEGEDENRFWVTEVNAKDLRPATTYYFRDVRFERDFLGSEGIKIAHLGGTGKRNFFLVRWQSSGEKYDSP